jgi:iron(III) transport system substrate-binding protein
LIGLQNGMGDKAWALFDELKKNGMVVSGPNAQAVTPVMQGAKAAVFGAVDYVSYGNISQGIPEGHLPGQRYGDCAASDDDP